MLQNMLIRWLVGYPKTAFCLCLLLVAITCSGLSKLWISIDYQVYYADDDPYRLALKNLESQYGKTQNAYLVIQHKDPKANAVTAEALQALHKLTESAWQIPFSQRVTSVTNYKFIQAKGDDIKVAPLLDNPSSLSATEIETALQRLQQEPAVNQLLLSNDKTMAAVSVGLHLPDNPIAETRQVTSFIRKLLADFEQRYPQLHFFASGSVFADEVFAVATEQDLLTLIPLSYGVLIIILVILLRSTRAMLLVLSIVTLSVTIAFGIKGWFNPVISPVTAFAPSMIMIIAVADCIHLLNGFMYHRRQSLSHSAAIIETLRLTSRPVILTSVTTIIGFLGMNFSSSPAFHDLGNVVAIGVGAALLLALVMLPAWLLIKPIPVSPKQSVVSRFMPYLAEKLTQHPYFFLAASLLFSLLLIVGISQNKINETFIAFFDNSFEFRQNAEAIDQHLTGLHRIDYILPAAKAEGIFQPSYLQSLASFSHWLRQQPEVAHVETYSDIIKRLNQALHGDNPAKYHIPEKAELIAQYQLLYELSLPYGHDLNNRISFNHDATRMTVRLWLTDSAAILAFDQRVQRWLAEQAPNIVKAQQNLPSDTQGIGIDMMFAHIALNNIPAMYYGTLVALFLISFIIIAALRSLKVGSLGMLTNLLPITMAFGLWGWLSGQVGLSISVVASLTLGLVVDDTVHLLHRYLHARRQQGLSPAAALSTTLASSGVAIVKTSIVLAASFAVLAASHYTPNAQLGLLTAITIIFALIIDLLLLPPLLFLLDQRITQPSVIKELEHASHS
ncbi:efflux RND transporter permease subunit [Zooshikella ganghwensis]|uniref:efflux RND transporter permease subunit n=1 Tax=Zooshikella ganghwensis TaxID=202772 RepID=UPI000426EB90|nr:MMPL family transporter [Zooshikella ganghwensis]